MYKWGKFIGALVGYFVFGALGAVVGFIIGLILEKLALKLQKPVFTRLTAADLERVRSEFFATTFAVMGYIASHGTQKDGDVSLVARRVMDRIGIPEHRRRTAMEYFIEGQAQDFQLHSTVTRFYRLHSDQPNLLEMFVELQLYAAYSKGNVNGEERDLLLAICYQMDMNAADFQRLDNLIKSEFKYEAPAKKGKKSKYKQFGLKDAYAILNTSPSASDEEIKQAYRRLTSKHHPDKLSASGMPEDMMRMAEQKTREIRSAYERIKEVRNL